MPCVSVIIPTYHHGNYVCQTLGAVFRQTFTDYEVIVVNDGSPDGTSDVLRPLSLAGKIKYVEQANAGAAVARNRGFAEATGEFIAFLDDDDLWPVDKLEWQIQALRENLAAGMVYGFTDYFGECQPQPWPGADGPSGDVYEAFRTWNWIWSPGQTLIRASAFRAVGGFDESLWGVDDWDLYIRLARLGPIIYVQRHALSYRVHSSNSSKRSWEMNRNFLRLRLKHMTWAEKFLNPLKGARVIASTNRAAATTVVGEAQSFFEQKRFAESRKRWRRLAWVWPFQFLKRGVLSAAMKSFLVGRG